MEMHEEINKYGEWRQRHHWSTSPPRRHQEELHRRSQDHFIEQRNVTFTYICPALDSLGLEKRKILRKKQYPGRYFMASYKARDWEQNGFKIWTKDWVRQVHAFHFRRLGILRLGATGRLREAMRRETKNCYTFSEIPAVISSEEDSDVACMAVAVVVAMASSLALLESAMCWSLDIDERLHNQALIKVLYSCVSAALRKWHCRVVSEFQKKARTIKNKAVGQCELCNESKRIERGGKSTLPGHVVQGISLDERQGLFNIYSHACKIWPRARTKASVEFYLAVVLSP